jgi:hypothetical protein
MKDQYDCTVPDDLVLLRVDGLSDAELKKIDALDWYELGRDEHPGFQGHVLVSLAALQGCINGTFEAWELSDVGFVGPIKEIIYIDSVLHRWEKDDELTNFYHA